MTHLVWMKLLILRILFAYCKILRTVQCSGIYRCHTLKNMLFHKKMFWYYEIISCSLKQHLQISMIISMTSLLGHSVAQPTEYRCFLWKFYAVTDFEVKFWWFLTQVTQATKNCFVASILLAKIYIWLAVQQLVCSKSEVMLIIVCEVVEIIINATTLYQYLFNMKSYLAETRFHMTLYSSILSCIALCICNAITWTDFFQLDNLGIRICLNFTLHHITMLQVFA